MKAMVRSLGMWAGAIGTLLRLWFDLLYGMYKISKLQHAPVTIFGGARLHRESAYMAMAKQLAHQLASNDIPVLTGGGPGIMEAASCGALSSKPMIVTTIGINVKGLDKPGTDIQCQKNVIELRNFGARKWLLIHYSIGFVVFPGGFGTLNELTELLTLIQTGLNPKAPIVLIGIDYWKPLMRWIEDSALKGGLIAAQDAALFTMTDDIDEAFTLLYSHCERIRDKQ